ncbi:MAG: dipeptidase, partial [Trueperaceae bacterium]|nr:dipeptidase [Trueperaceae bacterium]
FATARGQYAYYQALAKRGVIQQIRSREHLKSHLTAWQTWEGEQKAEQPPLGFLISMESADPILKPDELEEWWQLGVRSIGPAHYGPGRYAGGTSTEEGLCDIGFHLLKEMERLGIILDLTHLSDKAFWQALEHFSGKVIASHNNCRALVPHQRQFSDEQLLSIIKRDGVIGVAFDTWMLEPGWIKGESTNAGVGIAKVLDHIDHICALAGNSHNVGIGSDLDGGFGLEQSPHDLDTIADLALFPQLLKARDYKQTDIENIMHGNWLRFLEQALPET